MRLNYNTKILNSEISSRLIKISQPRTQYLPWERGWISFRAYKGLEDLKYNL
jgi:hypothetical protein